MASSITHKQLEAIVQEFEIDLADYKLFIETGTLHGDTTNRMARYFEELHTIELSAKFARKARKRFAKVKKIFVHQGDSAEVLPTLVKDLSRNAVFYLDGHWSRGETARGPKDVPLMEELAGIMGMKAAALVIIDDLRLFGVEKRVDWCDISVKGCEDAVRPRLVKSKQMDDRLILLLRPLSA